MAQTTGANFWRKLLALTVAALRQKGLAKYSRLVQYYCLPERPQGASKWGV
ncbi:MAG: hypothetical protein L7W95_08680 [Alphaproteobacteria bacterium]|nr:hypothetical protein [Alphaproteobacteria bacterium]